MNRPGVQSEPRVPRQRPCPGRVYSGPGPKNSVHRAHAITGSETSVIKSSPQRALSLSLRRLHTQHRWGSRRGSRRAAGSAGQPVVLGVLGQLSCLRPPPT